MSRLTADDWTRAGFRALARGGMAAIAVEPLAEALGASKGSFYWHFGKRDDLVTAVIDRWEAGTDQLIEGVEAGAVQPDRRLRLLFERVFADHPNRAVELALLGAADDPRVQAALDRVTQRRIGYLTAVMGELGLSPLVARRRAVFAYSAFLGQLQLQAATPATLRRATGSLGGYADEVIGVLTAPA